MSENQMILLICGIAFIIAIIYGVVKKPVSILHFLGRGALGIAIIYIVNSYIAHSALVGVNIFTIGVSAMLGLPGVILMYAVKIYEIFM